MATELITFKMDSGFLKEVDEAARTAGYQSRTEFIREALRNRVKDVKEDKAMETIRRLYGSTKGQERPRLTKEERNRIAENLCKNLDKQDEIFKRVGL